MEKCSSSTPQSLGEGGNWSGEVEQGTQDEAADWDTGMPVHRKLAECT